MRNFFLAVCVCFVLCGPVWAQNSPAAVAAPTAPRLNTNPLVPDGVLKAAGLKLQWQNTLAIRPNERLLWIKLLGSKLYALSSTNYLFCVDANTGKLSWSKQLVAPGFPISEFQPYGKEVMTTAGGECLEIDSVFGGVKSWPILYKPSCPPVRNSTEVFVAGTDLRLHVLDANEHVRLFDATANNDSLITGVLATEDYVVFATEEGNIVRMAANAPTLVWQFNALGKISAPLVRDANAVYAGSWDTNLYRIRVTDGKLLWKFQLGGILTRPAAASFVHVYQPVTNRGVTIINKEPGTELTTIGDGIAMLSESASNMYVLCVGHTAVILDSKTGKQVSRINLAGVDLYESNPADGRIFVAEKAGRVVCITPAGK